MSQSTINGQQVVVNDSIHEAAKQGNLNLFFLGLLSVSFVGYALFQKTWMGLVFGHTAGLSIMAFYGGLTGLVTKSKGYTFKSGYIIGFVVPIFLGVISAFLLPPGGRNLPLTCGGWTALASGLAIVLVSIFIKKRNHGD